MTAPHLSAPGESLEVKIGLYCLHKLGLVSVVLGISFLIVYSLQLLQPLAKLLIGASVAATLIICGNNMAAREKQKWFAHGLTAAGWSLAFFTTYAAHFVSTVALIHSLPVIILMLLVVAAGSLTSALSANSQIMAVYSITLASAAIVLSGPGLLSSLSFLIIALTASLLANHKQWSGLFKFAMAACYVGHLYCSASAACPQDESIAVAFLAAIWLAFAVGIAYALPGGKGQRKTTSKLACINAAVFALGLVFTSAGSSVLKEYLLTAGGAVYLAAARWLNNRSESQLQTVHSLLGLSLINCAKVMHFTGLQLFTIDVIEIAVLGVVAIRYQLTSFRWFAMAMSLTLMPLWLLGSAGEFTAGIYGFECFSYVKAGLWAAVVLFSLAAANRQKWMAPSIRAKHAKDSDFYFTSANLLLLLVFCRMTNANFAICALTLQAVANGILAFKFQNKCYGRLSCLGLCLTGFLWLASLGSWQCAPAVVAIASLYAGHGYTRIAKSPDRFYLKLSRALACLANVLLTLFMLDQLTVELRSAGLALEGLALIIAGCRLNDRFFRISGLFVLMLLTGKLLLIDLATCDPVARVVSFIAAGVVFLLASYGYGRFSRAFEEAPPESQDADIAKEACTGTITN